MAGRTKAEELGLRTKRLAIRVVEIYMSLPKNPLTYVLGRHLVRSGTSPGAVYREARRARSRREFLSKLENALQELDETGYWLELLAASAVPQEHPFQPDLAQLRRENEELLAIFATAVKSTKFNTPPR